MFGVICLFFFVVALLMILLVLGRPQIAIRLSYPSNCFLRLFLLLCKCDLCMLWTIGGIVHIPVSLQSEFENYPMYLWAFLLRIDYWRICSDIGLSDVGGHRMSVVLSIVALYPLCQKLSLGLRKPDISLGYVLLLFLKVVWGRRLRLYSFYQAIRQAK